MVDCGNYEIILFKSKICVLQIHNATLTVHARVPEDRETGGFAGALEGSKSILRKRETHDGAEERRTTEQKRDVSQQKRAQAMHL